MPSKKKKQVWNVYRINEVSIRGLNGYLDVVAPNPKIAAEVLSYGDPGDCSFYYQDNGETTLFDWKRDEVFFEEYPTAENVLKLIECGVW